MDHEAPADAFTLIKDFLKREFPIDAAWGDTTIMLMTDPIILNEVDPSTLKVKISDALRQPDKGFSLHEAGSLQSIREEIQRRIASRG